MVELSKQSAREGPVSLGAASLSQGRWAPRRRGLGYVLEIDA